ncbi:MAG TPA: hypothetical protein PLG90_00875 [Ignavibacteria bacterium]|nr:hypothetical protein [Ignavibacteria bacterium]
MFKFIFPLIIIGLLLLVPVITQDEIDPETGYPVWLFDSTGDIADQTSGLFFLSSQNKIKKFLICDDIGAISRIEVDENKNPPDVKIQKIIFSDTVSKFFKTFVKVDFEEVIYDYKTDRILISSEGNNNDVNTPFRYRKDEGIFSFTLNGDVETADSILNVEKVKADTNLFKFTRHNIAFEGFAESDNFYFLGLENYMAHQFVFSDSTEILVTDKNLNLIKRISTGGESIVTISGLYAISDKELIGIDRNLRRIFYLKFDNDWKIIENKSVTMNLNVPDYPHISDVVGIAPESLTMDNEQNIYVAIDPWKDNFMVDMVDREKLKDRDKKYFLNYTPILYKFKYPF